jgi:hypothetical protein
VLYTFQAVSPPIIMSSRTIPLTAAASKPGTYQMLCVQFELLMIGGETAQNVYSLDNNKEYYNIASC